MDDAVKRLAAEWVLTNGVLPGFKERLDASLSRWSTVAEPITVYRAHGHKKVGIVKLLDDPRELRAGLRPVLATSRNLKAIVEFAGEDCCIFAITLQPGTRYLDITAATAEIPDSILEDIRRESSSVGRWPPAKFPLKVLRTIMDERVHGIPGTKLPEDELLVYDNGALVGRKSVGIGEHGKEMFEVSYVPRVGGRISRGRTYRSKPKRSNKNGGRPTRKSQHRLRRNRYA